VKALLDLSLQPKYGPESVRAIAKRQDIPAPYLEKLLIEMRRAGLVTSIRGSVGGYKLAKKPAQISIGQILEAVGENITNLPLNNPTPAQTADWVTSSGTDSTKSSKKPCTILPWQTFIMMLAVGKHLKEKKPILWFSHSPSQKKGKSKKEE